MRPIDADALESYFEKRLTNQPELFGWLFARIADTPTVDMVEVVRCKDCKHQRERNQHEKEYLIEGVLICIHPEVSEDCWAAVFPTHFCSYGERKNDATD